MIASFTAAWTESALRIATRLRKEAAQNGISTDFSLVQFRACEIAIFLGARK